MKRCQSWTFFSTQTAVWCCFNPINKFWKDDVPASRWQNEKWTWQRAKGKTKQNLLRSRRLASEKILKLQLNNYNDAHEGNEVNEYKPWLPLTNGTGVAKSLRNFPRKWLFGGEKLYRFLPIVLFFDDRIILNTSFGKRKPQHQLLTLFGLAQVRGGQKVDIFWQLYEWILFSLYFKNSTFPA